MGFWDEVNDGVKVIVYMFILLVVASALYLGYARTFGTAFEDVRRDIYEHSRSYTEGATRDLNNLCLELDKADEGHKSILKDTIRNRFVKLDEADVPQYLRTCLHNARSAQ